MHWIERRRRKVLERHRTKLLVSILSGLGSFPFEKKQTKPGRLELHTTATGFLGSDLALRTSCGKIPLVGLSTLYEEPVALDVFPRTVPLISPEEISVTRIPLDDFALHITRFSFQAVRTEPPSLFGSIQTGPRLGSIPRVAAPPRPPSVDSYSLEERLKWILTPPIHELLSDPQLALPEKPYPFQTKGIKWLYDRDSALLADEMGLGKTMQAIIAARLLWRAGLVQQILVICPKTLISCWETEIRKWWPQASNSIMIASGDRQWFLRMGTANVIFKIINYEGIQRELDWLGTQKFSHDLIIIDEAQRIKNPKSKTSRAVKALKSPRRWALTGTPLENKIDDLVSIFEFLRPSLLRYDQPEFITERIGPYLLRRRTEEVLPQLPDKSEYDIGIELGPDQRKSYQQMEESGVLQLNAKGDSITVTHIFSLINKLRQLCNFCPVSGRSAKLERLLEDLEEISQSGRKALVFSQFVSDECGLRRLAKELGAHDEYVTLELHGKIPQHHRDLVVKQFCTQSDKNVLLLNFQVGGVGLNLQAANYVFLFDRWWNPAVEDQAVKRTHRIGQTRKVFIRRFYCKDTIEERILQKLAEKRRLFRYVIDESRPEPDSLGLSEEEIFSLFNLTVRPRSTSKGKGAIPLVLENMDATEFENLVAKVYEKQGYTVGVTPGSHDGGVDVWAERENPGGNERFAIQCKHQKTNVGRPVLQQLWDVVCDDPSITRGVLVTSAGFSSEGKQFADGKRFTLIDGDALADLVRKLGIARFVPPSTSQP